MKIPRVSWLCHAVFLFVCSTVPAFAQSPVTGCIEDSTHAVIPGATVVLQGARRFQSYTDEKGCFALADVANGRYHLEILAQAFAPVEKEVEVSGRVELEKVVLEVQPIRNSIVVTATRTPAPSMTLGASVEVIDRQQIESTEARNAIDLLRSVPGLAVMRSGDIGGITSMFMRGGESDYTKILVDGVPVNQPGGIYDISHLSADNIERIEIVRGPQSALFGSDAITGVVQVFTKAGGGPPELGYSAEGGSFATTQQRGTFRGSYRKFDFSNSFGRVDTDNIGRNNDYRNASYSGNFGYALGRRQALRATLMQSSVKAGAPGVNAPGFTSFGPNNRMSRLERQGGLTYHALVGSRATQHVAYRLYDHDQYFYSSFGVSTVLHTRHRFEYHGDVVLPVGGTFSYGVDYDRENATVAAARYFRNNYGYYAQQQVDAFGKLHVTAGVRVEDNTTFGTVASPRVAVSYNVTPATRLRFNAGTGVKEPSFVENYSQSSFFLGNPTLLSERSRSWETGVEQSFLNNRITGDVAWFDNRFRNMIELVRQPNGSSRYENIGRTEARGLELRVRGRTSHLSAQAGYTFLEGNVAESKQTSFPNRPGDPLLRRPKHSADLLLTWTHSNWNANWSTRYVGRRADSDFFAYTARLFSNARYVVSGAALTYDFSRHFSAYMRLENLFDRNYQEVLGYQALGRSVVVGARLKVGFER